MKKLFFFLYFKKDLSLRNIYHNPLLLIIRIYNFFSQRIKVDHVAHISRFIWNQEDNKFEAKIFEATIERGMEQNDLIDKIKNYHGTVLIETLNKKVEDLNSILRLDLLQLDQESIRLLKKEAE